MRGILRLKPIEGKLLIFNWASKENQDYTDFASMRSVICVVSKNRVTITTNWTNCDFFLRVSYRFRESACFYFHFISYQLIAMLKIVLSDPACNFFG